MISNTVKRSLRAKVTLGVVLPLILILAAFTAIEYDRHQITVLANLSQLASLSGQVIESNLRHAMLNSDFSEVRSLLRAIGEGGQFKIVYVLDTRGRVIFAADKTSVGTYFDNRQANCQSCHSLPVNMRPSSVVVTAGDGQRVFRSMHPIRNEAACAECHDSSEPLLGLLLTDIAVSPMEAAISANLQEKLLWWVGAIAVTVVVVNLVLSRFVLRRLEALAGAITGLGEGKRTLPLPEAQCDEIGQVAAAFNTMAQQVEERDTENRALSADLRRQHAQRGELLRRLITAQETERQRVARELHDELGQALTGLALRAELMERLLISDSNSARANLDQIRTLINETMERMYDLILDLRPSALDDLGLAVALRVYAERLLCGTGVAFELAVDRLNNRLPPTIEVALYRIFQETLSNVVRHARASNVIIKLARRNGTFEGSVEDDGQGFDLESVHRNGHTPHGLGLLGIQERVAQCGGKLSIVSRPGSGTRVHVCIPLMEDEACG